jgi:hypothetical protein
MDGPYRYQQSSKRDDETVETKLVNSIRSGVNVKCHFFPSLVLIPFLANGMSYRSRSTAHSYPYILKWLAA